MAATLIPAFSLKGEGEEQRAGGLVDVTVVRHGPFDRLRAGSSMDSDSALRERYDGSPRPEEGGSRTAPTRDWTENAGMTEGWLLNSGVWFDTGRRVRRPGSPRTVGWVTARGWWVGRLLGLRGWGLGFGRQQGFRR